MTTRATTLVRPGEGRRAVTGFSVVELPDSTRILWGATVSQPFIRMHRHTPQIDVTRQYTYDKSTYTGH